jgi:hypothetical protein
MSLGGNGKNKGKENGQAKDQRRLIGFNRTHSKTLL